MWRYLTHDSLTNEPIISDIDILSSDTCAIQKFISSTPKNLIPLKEHSSVKRSRTIAEITRTEKNVIGERKVLIILVQFPDRQFVCSNEQLNHLFNQAGYRENGATGSVFDFFHEVSEGQLAISSSIIGPFTTANPMSYYGRNTGLSSNDANPYAMFQEALEFAKSQVDLREYDCYDDGLIDNIHIIYAGYGEEAGASANAIWTHESSFKDVAVYENLSIDRYSCSPELRGNKGETITTIGPPCHEICHALGAMDFYDTDYSPPAANTAEPAIGM